MGKWSLYNPDELEKIEKELIQMTHLPITKHKVMIDSINFMSCLTCGNPSLPPLVIIHGFGGTGLVFFKVLPKLASKFYIYLIDHLGMGRSSRPEFRAKNPKEVESFFVEPIEAVVNYFNLDFFTLVGHSFGGYIAGCYILSYPKRIKKIIFLSSVGICEQPHDYDFVGSLTGSWIERFREKLIMFLWMRNITPLTIMRKLGPLGHLFVLGMFGHRIQGITQDEVSLMVRYLEQVNSIQGSGEFGIAVALNPGTWAKSPLVKRIDRLSIPMRFVFGDRDWVKPYGAQVLLKMAPEKVKIYTLSDSDHHMYWDNPIGLADIILIDNE